MFKHKYDEKNSVVSVTTIYEYEEFDKKFNKLLSQACSKIKVPGYRPGKAPKEQLLARISQFEIQNQVLDEFLNSKKSDIFKYLQDQGIKFVPYIDGVDIKDSKDKDNKDLELEVTFATFPLLENVKYDDVDVEFSIKQISKSDLENEKQAIFSKFNTPEKVEDKNAKSKLNDIVNIDFKGYINDQPFDGGEAEGYNLKLGSNTFIPGFEEQLLDKKVGYKGEVKVKFPENYFVKEYANKDVVFDVKINEILRNKYHKIDDEVVKKLNIENVNNVKEFDKYMNSLICMNNLTKAINNYLEKLAHEVFEKSNISIHKFFLTDEMKSMKSDFEKALNTNGLKKRDYLKLIKSSDEDLEKEFFNQALEKVGTNLVLMNMKNNIEENDKDYEEKYIKTFEKHFPSEAQELSKFISYFLRIFEKIGKTKVVDEVNNYISKNFK
ncbi:trigger factor [Mycoplasmopsis cynos]|uniref:trigger factor n=1 Tax=Mycoplasmopsis cynos TaxID=171284 RepID=UPI002AFEE95F|nr:trigger factor [Mycoplasmopsis cynos]WQQ17524.1 trigger factor [Mycoplasmopsis cynos]